MIELLHIDCMEYMKTLPDKAFDLAIVDPEYRDDNQPDQNMRKSGTMKHWKGAPKADYFSELFRVSKNQIIFGGNYFTEHLAANNNWFVWYKNNDGTHMSMAEMAWVSIRKNIKVFDYRPMGNNVDWHPTAKPIKVYKYLLHTYAKRPICTHKHTEDYNHLCTDCNKPFKILDTHLGSGSSAIAAHDMGFDFVGCEIDQDYYQAALKRYNNAIKQTKLF